jgi:non-ribosomal peptide synthetase component F
MSVGTVNSSSTIAFQFEMQAAATPDKLAVVTHTRTHTYAELDALASDIAGYLSAISLIRCRPVAVLLPESASLYAAILGIAKAGGIFVTLESTVPEKSLAEIVTQADVSLILSDDTLLGLAQRVAGEHATAVNLSALPGRRADQVALPNVLPNDPAYIIYTSGTAGRPKGVTITDRQSRQRIERRRDMLGANSTRRVAYLLPTGFSAGLNQVLLTLLTGATLYPFNLHTMGMNNFSKWLLENNVTYMHMVGSLLRTWLSTIPEHVHFPSLKTISIGSEPLYGSDIHRVSRHLGH